MESSDHITKGCHGGSSSTSDSGIFSSSSLSTSSSSHNISSVSSHHMKTPSSSSSGYYSRLDSSEDIKDRLRDPLQEEDEGMVETEEGEDLKLFPWQYYVTPDNDSSEDDLTPLHSLVLEKGGNNHQRISKVISILPHPSLLNATTKEMWYTPLHLATITNQPLVVRALIVGGARADLQDKEGETPVHIACKFGFSECLEGMVRAGSQEEEESVVIGVRSGVGVVENGVWNRNGQSPLHLSITSSSGSEVNPTLPLLLYMSTPTGVKDGRGGRTPLHLAVEKRNLSVLELLLRFTKKEDISLEDYKGLRAVEVAAINGWKEGVELMEKVGMSVRDWAVEESESDEEDEEMEE